MYCLAMLYLNSTKLIINTGYNNIIYTKIRFLYNISIKARLLKVLQEKNFFAKKKEFTINCVNSIIVNK